MKLSEALRPKKRMEIELNFSGYKSNVVCVEKLFSQESIAAWIDEMFKSAKILGLHFDKMKIDGKDIVEDEDYTFYLYRKKYQCKVGIGSMTGICTGSEYQWAEGVVTHSTFVDEKYLNRYFGIKTSKHYSVRVTGMSYQYFPYSNKTNKWHKTFNNTICFVPKIHYNRLIKKFDLKLEKGLKIKIERIDNVLSIRHQGIQKKNVVVVDEKTNSFATLKNNILTLYITNKTSGEVFK